MAGLDEASAAYREAQKNFERQQSLVQRQLVSASQFDIQRALRDAAKGRLDQIRAQLSDRVIAAPFDGVLGLRLVSPGSLVTPGTVITTLDDVSRIKLDFSVPERDLSALSIGQAVVSTSDAFPGEQFRGLVTSVGSRVDPMTRALGARAEFDNPGNKLRPGMLLEVRLQRPARDTLQVPELSLQQVGRQSFVFRVGGDGKVAQVPVRRERGGRLGGDPRWCAGRRPHCRRGHRQVEGWREGRRRQRGARQLSDGDLRHLDQAAGLRHRARLMLIVLGAFC